MTNPLLRLYQTLIPLALFACLIALILTAFSQELDRTLTPSPGDLIPSELPSILPEAASDFSNTHLARLVAYQLIPSYAHTLNARLKRAAFTSLLPYKYKKESLLAFFLNRTHFDRPHNPPVRGLVQAAAAYFDLPPRRLTTGETVLLLHLARFPENFTPLSHPDKTLALREKLLQNLQNSGLIPASQFHTESNRPLALVPDHNPIW